MPDELAQREQVHSLLSSPDSPDSAASNFWALLSFDWLSSLVSFLFRRKVSFLALASLTDTLAEIITGRAPIPNKPAEPLSMTLTETTAGYTKSVHASSIASRSVSASNCFSVATWHLASGIF